MSDPELVVFYRCSNFVCGFVWEDYWAGPRHCDECDCIGWPDPMTWLQGAVHHGHKPPKPPPPWWAHLRPGSRKEYRGVLFVKPEGTFGSCTEPPVRHCTEGLLRHVDMDDIDDLREHVRDLMRQRKQDQKIMDGQRERFAGVLEHNRELRELIEGLRGGQDQLSSTVCGLQSVINKKDHDIKQRDETIEALMVENRELPRAKVCGSCRRWSKTLAGKRLCMYVSAQMPRYGRCDDWRPMPEAGK